MFCGYPLLSLFLSVVVVGVALSEVCIFVVCLKSVGVAGFCWIYYGSLCG